MLVGNVVGYDTGRNLRVVATAMIPLPVTPRVYASLRCDTLEAMTLEDPIEYSSQLEEFARRFKPPISWQTVDAVRKSVTESDDEVAISVVLPKKTAVKVLNLIDLNRTSDAIIVPAQSEFSVADAAVILRKPKDEIEGLISCGEIPAIKRGLTWTIKPQDVVNYLDEKKTKRQAAARHLALMTAP